MSAWRTALAVFAFTTTTVWAAPPGVALVGKGSIPGTALDKSGLTGNICQAGAPANCIPNATLGGLGSALAYTGHDNVYVAAPDRGPFDGLTDIEYQDRVHFLHLKLDAAAPFPNIKPTLLDTRLLKDYYGRTFVGAAGNFERRFDPEGIRVGLLGTLLISDEYGPYVYEFGPLGRLVRRIKVPARYAIQFPSGDPTIELTSNTSGRQANRGMEGLAISPNGRYAYGMMQNALLQDNALTPGTTDRQSVHTRILKMDLLTGKTSEYVYVLEAANRGQGVSEILAINDDEFLVIERDNRSFLAAAPQAPTRKKIFKIRIGASTTDVSGIDGIAAGTATDPLPASIVPVEKTPFIDLLDASFGLQLNDANAIAEKIEGLAWGPDLADGRHVLYVISDNDLNTALATQIFAFAIDPTVVDLQKQFQPLPLYPRRLLPRD